MKIGILTEALPETGLGHLFRCESIYQAIAEKKIEIIIIANSKIDYADFLKHCNFRIYDWLNNITEFSKEFSDLDIVLVDSYLATISNFQELASNFISVVYIDDMNRLQYPKGIIVNTGIFSTKIPYPSNRKLLLGIQYALLRIPFWDLKPIVIKKKIETLLITFGGDDIRNLSPRVPEFLNQTYPELEKIVIVGSGFKNTEEILNLKTDKVKILFNPDAVKMKEAMLQSDIAITAAGQTTYELARCGVPMIAISVSENQFGNVTGFKESNVILYAGDWFEKNLMVKIQSLLLKIESFELRQELSKNGQSLVDGQGARRLATDIVNAID